MRTRSIVAASSRGDANLSPLADAILQVIDRIEAVLQEEEVLLSRSAFAEIDPLATRKNHLALELGHLIDHAGHSIGGGAVVKDALSRLGNSLAANALLLRRHMEATSEISTILANAVATASADGIYTSDYKSAGAGRQSCSR